jgi:hypothetical protein
MTSVPRIFLLIGQVRTVLLLGRLRYWTRARRSGPAERDVSVYFRQVGIEKERVAVLLLLDS